MGTEKEKMNRATKYGYGTGHIMNDMCASLWFTYLLLYYEKVINLGAVYAGIVLLVGQIADGIATIVVGILSDRETHLRVCLNYGKRKSWHLIGTVGVLLSYPFLFAPAIGINRDVVQCTGNTECDDNKLMTIYYSVFSAIHNISWAFVQISHLAMIPEITSNERQRGFLTTMRNIGAVMSNIFVYSILWIMLGTGGSSDKIGPDNVETFRDVMLISVVGIGGLSSLIFHIIIKPSYEASKKVQHVENLSETAAQPQSLKAQSSIASSLGGATKMGIFKWFLKPSFYLVAVVYMVTRLFVNVSNSYVSLYIQSTLNLEPVFVAMVPLVMYIAGFIISVFLKFLTKRIGFKASFALSCLIGLGGCVWIWFGCHEETAKYEIFPVAILLGGGGSAMLISSLTIVSSLIGKNTESSAFVYGAMSFVDKFSCGIVLMLIQNSAETQSDNMFFHKYAIVYTCGGASLLGLITIACWGAITLRKRKNNSKEIESSNSGKDNPSFQNSEVHSSINSQINIVGSNEEINGPKDRYHHQISVGEAPIESVGSKSLQEPYFGLKSNEDINPNN